MKKVASPFVDDKVHWVSPSSIHKNEFNWRKHPKEQLAALQEAYFSIGFVDPITVSAKTRKIIDGHGRLEAAIKEKLKAVPILLVNLTPEQELLHLQNADNIAALARPDTVALRKLVERNQQTIAALPKRSNAALHELQKRIDDHSTILNVKTTYKPAETIFDITERLNTRRDKDTTSINQSASKDNEVAQKVFRDDVIFEGDDDWGIPILLTNPKLLCVDPPTHTYDRDPETIKGNPWVCYSARGGFLKTLGAKGGTLGFYCEDIKFAHLADHTNEYGLKFKEEGWTNIVEPDYSVWEQDPSGNPYPFAASLWNIYRSRYVARYMQELGMRVLPILRWTADDKLFDACVGTLPTNLPWLAVQIRSNMTAMPAAEIRRMERGFQDAINTTTPQGLIVYGDLAIEQWIKGMLPKSTKLIMLKSFMSSMTDRRSAEAKAAIRVKRDKKPTKKQPA
jgi:hypothetical protein